MGGDLSSFLLSEVDAAARASDGNTFGAFKRTLRGRGVPFSVIKSATPRERADLANAVYPASEMLQDEVLQQWPLSGPHSQPSVAWRQQDAEIKSHRNTRRRSASEASSASRSSSRSGRSISESMIYRQPKIRTPQGKPISPRMKVEKEKQRQRNDTKLWQSPAVARARAAARAAEVRGSSRGRSQSGQSIGGRSQSGHSFRGRSQSGHSFRGRSQSTGRSFRGRSQDAASSARSPPLPQRRSGSSISRQQSQQRASPRGRSTSTTRSTLKQSKQSVRLSRRSVEEVSRGSSTTPRSRSPSPFNSNQQILPVGTQIVTCRLSKTAPEINNILGTVTAPANRDSYVPVTFPAPYNDMVIHISKLRPYSEVANERRTSLRRRDSLSRKPVCRTGRVFTDFRWLHPCNPPPPPPTIVEHANSFRKSVEQKPKAAGKKSTAKKRKPGTKPSLDSRKQKLRREQLSAIGAQMQEVRNAETEYGSTSVEVVAALWRLSIVLSNEERVEEAIPHARSAYQILSDVINDNRDSISDIDEVQEILLGVKCTLAAALHDDGQHSEAIKLFTPSKQTQPHKDTEGAGNISEQESAYSLLELHNLSVLYEKSGNFIAAEPHARKSIQGLSAHYGNNNSVTTASLCNLSLILYERGESVEAAVLAKRAHQDLSDSGPAGKMKQLIQKLINSVPPGELVNSALLEKKSSARTGMTWCNTTLAGIAKDSPASLMQRFKGWKLSEVSGRYAFSNLIQQTWLQQNNTTQHTNRAVSCDSEIRSCCEDAVFIVFTFVGD